VTTTDPAPVEGRLIGVDDAGLAFEDGSVVPWDRVVRGKVQVEFSREPLDDAEGDAEGEAV
jgi:hypothetical protein